MQKLILVCGPAAIGKSTFCSDYANRHPKENVHVIAADELRRNLFGSYRQFPPERNMTIIYEEMVRQSKRLLKTVDNLTVLLDTTMLYDDRRMYFADEIKGFDRYELVLLKLHDYSLCLERNKQRSKDKWVPEEVIIDMSKHYDDPSPECQEKFDSYEDVYVD